MDDFLLIILIKIGAQDIQNDKVSAKLVLNSTFQVSEDKRDPMEKVKQRSFTIRCGQYLKMGGKSGHYGLQFEEGAQMVMVEHSFA